MVAVVFHRVLDDVEQDQLVHAPVSDQFERERAFLSDQDLDTSTYCVYLERIEDLLDVLLNILDRAGLVIELIFPNLHFLNLVAVVELHSLARLVDGSDNLNSLVALLETLLILDLGIMLLK